MNIIKKISSNKYVCISFFALALIYGIVLPFCWGNDPSTMYGTLSLLCENHIPFFWIWAVLTGGCFLFNTEYMYMKFGYKNRLLDAFLLLSVIGMFIIAATLGHSIENWNPKRVLHWTGTIMYILFIAAAILLFFLLNLKIKGFKALAVIMAVVFAGIAVWFIILGRSGYMEMVPVAAVEILLFVVNFTPLIKAREKVK